MDNMKLGSTHQVGEKLSASLFPFLWKKKEKEIENKALEILQRFKLDVKKDDFAASLSGGQRKLLEMARALMTDPELVMLDEPMAGVNPALTQSLLDHILGLKAKGMTILFVEHDMHVVQHIPDEVMKNTAVIDAYLGSHQDDDLGTVTGRITLPKNSKEK
jgi:branched-chain amino acid transport system ATP-binding protein